MTDLTYTLDQIDAACEAATDGPWRWSNTNRNAVYLYGARTRVVMGFDRLGMQGAQPTFRGSDGLLYKSATENINDFDDARFIALARTALPELAAKVRELEARLDAIAAYAGHPGNWGTTDGRGRLIHGLATGAIDPASRDWSNTELPETR